jgi:hypothetical protein
MFPLPVSEPPTPKSRRSLILLSKVLQNLANNVEFGEKETFMLHSNAFVTENQKFMKEFLDKLASVNPEELKDKLKRPSARELLWNAKDCITSYLAQNADKLKKHFEEDQVQVLPCLLFFFFFFVHDFTKSRISSMK